MLPELSIGVSKAFSRRRFHLCENLMGVSIVNTKVYNIRRAKRAGENRRGVSIVNTKVIRRATHPGEHKAGAVGDFAFVC